MRTIIYGVGAIGGTVAAALALSGREVVGIARGAQLSAIQGNGLLLRSPEKTARATFRCVADPTGIQFRPDDVILLTMKSQDTIAALERLRAAGAAQQPFFCVQNGVANERFVLRRFPNVHGVMVMMTAEYTIPGEVCAFSTPRHGILEIGRYPAGRDDCDYRLARALEAANVAAFVIPDVMQSKYGKLLMNLRNVVEAALGVGADTAGLATMLRAEGEAVFAAAGIKWRDVTATDPRRELLMRQQAIEGVSRSGGSSTQSLVRGTGSIETDYLNGEIVFLGRLHGVPATANAYFLGLSARMVREGLEPGTISLAEINAGLTMASNC